MDSWRDERWRTGALRDAPGFKAKSPVPTQNCGNCRYYKGGACGLYAFRPKAGAWCQSWQDAKFYGYWGGGHFPHHGTPPKDPMKPENMDSEGMTTPGGSTDGSDVPTGTNDPNSGSGTPAGMPSTNKS